MITKNDKQHIYNVLKAHMPPEQPVPIATVAMILNNNGASPKNYGYDKTRSFLEDLPEFITVMPVIVNKVPNQDIVLRKYGSDPEPPPEAISVRTREGNRLTRDEKLEIYHILRKNLPTGKVLPLSLVGQVLTANGCGRERYGIGKMKDILSQLGEFITLSESNEGVVPQTFAVINDTDIDIEHSETPRHESVSTKARPAAKDHLEEEDKLEIYSVLRHNIPVCKHLAMAVVSKVLNDNGCDKERFGFSKMKSMLSALPEFIEFKEVILGGVPQTLVTVVPIPEWDRECGLADNGVDEDPYRYLPRTLDESVDLPMRTLEKLNLAATDIEMTPSPEIIKALKEGYRTAREAKQFQIRRGAYIFKLDIQKSNGDSVVASIKRATSGQYNWFLNFAGTAAHGFLETPNKMLEHFAYVSSKQQFLEQLASKALPESWDFEGSPNKSRFILQRYIQYTFYRLQLEDKVCISEDGAFAAFNTGLVSPYYDDIYACFEPYDDPNGQWRFKFAEFCTAAGRGIGKKLVEYFNPLPQPASYFDRKEDLIFDLEKELHTDFEHILLDNTNRLPLSFIREECRGSEEAARIIRRIESTPDFKARRIYYNELSDIIEQSPRLFNRMRSRIDGAIELARKRVRWNYRTAIPCYFPTRNVLSLMLPLALESDNKADVALVVESTPSGNYQGQTILTLQQAYMDARLICCPNNDWLDNTAIAGDCCYFDD